LIANSEFGAPANTTVPFFGSFTLLLPLTTVKLIHTPFSSYTANELFDGNATVIVFPTATCGILNHFASPFACSVTLDDGLTSSGFYVSFTYV